MGRPTNQHPDQHGRPGSVPPHNAHLFVCGPRSSASGGGADGSDLQFSRLADEALQEAAEAHAERPVAPSSIAWAFGLCVCECPPECDEDPS